MIRTIAALLLSVTPVVAIAAPARTVAWYADHPGVMSQVLAACRDDPGHMRADPDCINAGDAQVVVAERRIRIRSQTENPLILRWKMENCAVMAKSKAWLAQNDCPPQEMARR